MIDITQPTFIYGWIAFAVLICPLQFFVAAPYGRHTSSKWGPVINSKAGWVIMELVSLAAFVYAFYLGGNHSLVSLGIALLFVAHYIHRSLIYPLMTRTGNKTMPIAIVLFAIIFNIINGYINGDYLGTRGDVYPDHYLLRWNFVLGVLLFVVGAAINIRSDYYLISLRKNTSAGNYVIPEAGLFKYLSCPNLFGEIIEWIGFAILCWNLPSVAFAAWTITNLVPRAWHHHKWYKQRFEDYPKHRFAVFPGLL